MTEVDDRIDRRTFLFGALAVGVQAATADTSAKTFSQWLAASAKAREAELASRLDRIRTLDGDIRAWVQVLPQSPTGKGKLLGIPFGVKDIIETKGLSTEYGSPIYKGRIGTADAAIVRQLRERGGVLLGKTHSTAFAYSDPAPTHNPRVPDSRAAVRRGDALCRRVQKDNVGAVQGDADRARPRGDRTGASWTVVDRRFPDERAVDRLGYSGRHDSNTNAERVATGPPTDRESRRGCARPSNRCSTGAHAANDLDAVTARSA
jgi:Amidase